MQDGGAIKDQGFPSDVLTSSLARRIPARTRSTISTAFQLRDGADDHHDRSSQRTAGVDLLAGS